KLLIGYTPHRSRPGLLAAVQQRSREIILALGTNKDDEIIIETQPPHWPDWRMLHRLHWPHRGASKAGRRATGLYCVSQGPPTARGGLNGISLAPSVAADDVFCNGDAAGRPPTAPSKMKATADVDLRRIPDRD